MQSHGHMEALALCRHCGNTALPHSQFCCDGCESVFQLLSESGLSNFYQLKEKYQFAQPLQSSTKKIDRSDWRFLEAEEQRLHLEGIHCLGCLWVLEKLPSLEKGILESRLDLSSSILSIRIDSSKISWPHVKQWIERLGYRAKPINPDEAPSDRESIIRLGVAAFSAGNVMLLSVSIYGGATGFLAQYFSQIAFLLAAPSLFYSAWPIYRSALLPLRRGIISVDLPIAMALISGIALSTWHLIQGSSLTYVDSLSMLVLLLLSSRLYLQKERERIMQNGHFLPFTQTEIYELLAPERKSISLKQIIPGQIIQLRKGQVVPADGILRSKFRVHCDLSFLTGESDSIGFGQNDSIDAGAKVLEDLELEVTRLPQESRLATILKKMKSFRLGESQAVLWADRIGQIFVCAVLAASALMFFLWPASVAIERSLTLAIVTCPCILAFSIPLVYQRYLEIGARKGILWRNIGALESLGRAKNFFLDKTGTLTDGAYSMVEEKYFSSDEEVKSAVLSLEQKSTHPLAKFLVKVFSQVQERPVQLFVETPSLGVRGYIQGKLWSVEKGPTTTNKKTIEVRCDGALMASLTLEDALREDSARCVSEIKKYGEVRILSGDHESVVKAIANQCKIPYQSNLSPEEKASLVSATPDSVMVGDGINDVIAFEAADTSIAVQGSIELSLQNADLYLSKPGLSLLLEAREMAQAAMRLVKLNFAATLSYNLIAAALVFAGKMDPLWAAVLMPLSALTVSALTIVSTGGNK